MGEQNKYIVDGPDRIPYPCKHATVVNRIILCDLPCEETGNNPIYHNKARTAILTTIQWCNTKCKWWKKNGTGKIL